MKNNVFQLIKNITVPLLAGGFAGLLTRDAMSTYQNVNQPPLAPPAWLFPVVWTILYTLMGISAWLIKNTGVSKEKKQEALSVYYYQLVVNFLWPVFFFNFQWFLFSFFWLVLLWILVFVMIRRFYEISKPASFLNIPYLLWLTFAAYLNLAVWWLN